MKRKEKRSFFKEITVNVGNLLQICDILHMFGKIKIDKSMIQYEQGKSDIDLTKSLIITTKWRTELAIINNIWELKNCYRVTYINEQM